MNLRKFYEAYNKNLVSDNWPIERAKIALTEIPKKSKILNLGCGIGLESKIFSEYGHEVIGVDISRNALKKAKFFQKKSFRFDLMDVPYPFLAESFNVIYSSEVVEHLPFIDPFLKECYRILRLNGLLILTTDNPAYLKNRFRLLFGSSDWTAAQEHFHYYTPKKLKDFLEKQKFKIKFWKGIGNFPLLTFSGVYMVGATK